MTLREEIGATEFEKRKFQGASFVLFAQFRGCEMDRDELLVAMSYSMEHADLLHRMHDSDLRMQRLFSEPRARLDRWRWWDAPNQPTKWY